VSEIECTAVLYDLRCACDSKRRARRCKTSVVSLRLLTSHLKPASWPPRLSLLPAPSDLLLADSKAEAIKRVKSAGTLGDHGGGAGELVLRFCAKTAILVVSVFILSDHAERIPRLALEYLYGKSTYSSL